jgi:histidyl-tRNA synthetase
MRQWLLHNRQQYQIFMHLLDMLLGQGFEPVPTPPTRDAQYRLDHTRAIVEILSSFQDEVDGQILKVFSTGPLYQPHTASWAEAIDVEILNQHDLSAEYQALELIGQIIPTLGPEMLQGQLTMAFGHIGWLEECLTCAGIERDAQAPVKQRLMTGQLAEVERMLQDCAPPLAELLVPHDASSFFARLQHWLGRPLEIPQWPLPTVWRLVWDLSLTGNWPYYTGLVFSLNHPQVGHPLLTGGRFQLAYGQRLWDGVGFTFYPDPLHRYIGIAQIEEWIPHV